MRRHSTDGQPRATSISLTGDLRMARDRRTIPLMREQSSAARDCPLAPPGHASVQSRALHRACLIVGGIDPLARQLDQSADDLRRWLRGEELPPEPVLLGCVEIILLYAATAGKAS